MALPDSGPAAGPANMAVDEGCLPRLRGACGSRCSDSTPGTLPPYHSQVPERRPFVLPRGCATPRDRYRPARHRRQGGAALSELTYSIIARVDDRVSRTTSWHLQGHLEGPPCRAQKESAFLPEMVSRSGRHAEKVRPLAKDPPAFLSVVVRAGSPGKEIAAARNAGSPARSCSTGRS